jgi:hypothetical protein
MDSEPDGQALDRTDMDGSVNGHVVVGDHSLVVHTDGGSTVTVRTGQPPKVARRVPPDAGPPRPMPEPLGRERELAEIAQALDDGLPVQVYGSDGSGRSTVLRHVARVRDGDRNVVFLSACGLTIDDLLQSLFDACFDSDGYRPEPARMRLLMAEVHALLLVDDFDGDAEDLTALLDAVPACEIVVASRKQSLGSGGLALELGGLAEAAAGIALLARELGRSVAADERAGAAELWRAVGGSPLALVQVAAAVREGAGTLADFRDSQQVARVLARSSSEPQRKVLGILNLIGPVPAPVALLTALIGSPCEAAVERLVASGLVTDGQPRMAGQLAQSVAALAATSVVPARLAEAITAWLAAEPDRRLLGESAPLILQVLRATMAAGGYRTAVQLARVASPRLAKALHLGAWGTLLELGHSAARAAGATDDEAYFAHEAAARLKSLGLAAVGTPAVQPPTGPGRGGTRKLATKPAVWAAVVTAAAIAGTIAFTAFDADDPPQAAQVVGPTIAPTRSAPPVTSAEPTAAATGQMTPVSSSGPITSAAVTASAAASASAVASTSRPARVWASASADATMVSPSECAPFVGALNFAPVMVGGSDTVKYSFLSRPCHPYGLDTGHMSIQGMGSSEFSFSLVSCPEITTSGENAPCTIAVTFSPSGPGDFTAEIYIPEAPAAEQRSYGSISLYGHAD